MARGHRKLATHVIVRVEVTNHESPAVEEHAQASHILGWAIQAGRHTTRINVTDFWKLHCGGDAHRGISGPSLAYRLL
jgi:hypothetical protein